MRCIGLETIQRCLNCSIMISNKQNGAVWLLCLIVILLLASMACWQHYNWRWKQNLVDLDGTVQAGMEIQQVADSFKDRFQHYPTQLELAQILNYICNYKEGVSPYQTDKIVSVFDNSGGWFYKQTNGGVKINYDGHYAVGFRSRIEVSKINFRLPTKVIVVLRGKPEILDYSRLDDLVKSEEPEIQRILTNWAATNVLAAGSKNAARPK